MEGDLAFGLDHGHELVEEQLEPGLDSSRRVVSGGKLEKNIVVPSQSPVHASVSLVPKEASRSPPGTSHV